MTVPSSIIQTIGTARLRLSCMRGSSPSMVKRLFTGTKLAATGGGGSRTMSSTFFTGQSRMTQVQMTKISQSMSAAPLLHLRAFSQTPLLQFARGRLLNIRNTYYSQPSGKPGFGGGSPFKNNWIKRRIDRIDSNYFFYGLMTVNATVFAGWWYAQQNWVNFRDPKLVYWMQNNFTNSWRNLQEGRVWTLITSAFSHNAADHILLNLMTFYFMAPPAIALLGNTSFLALYLGGGLAASGLSLAWNLIKGRTNSSSHGASGAIYAVTAFYATAFPRTTFLIFFIIPAPAWLVVGGLAVWDLFSAISDKRLGTDTMGHLGGMATGFLYAMKIMGRRPF